MIKNHIVYSNFAEWTLRLTKAAGSYLWDEKGKKLIDFTSGWNVTNLGWNNKEIQQAVIKQLKQCDSVPGWTSHKIQEEYAALLVSVLPKGLTSICRATGGTEANEIALKLAWTATGRKKVIGLSDSYHGASLATVLTGYRWDYTRNIFPYVPEFIKIPYPQDKLAQEFLHQVEQVLKKRDVAALVTEPGLITGWGSTLIAPKGMMKALRRLTKQYGTLLIFDEVGTGFSRCGKLFGMELEGVVPDIVTFAKGISNGTMPIGATVTRQELAEAMIAKTNLYSTFGWTPPACAAALATLKIHTRDKVWEKAVKKGQFILNELTINLSDHPLVGSIRGIGMELAITFVQDKKTNEFNSNIAQKVVRRARDSGLFLVFGGDGNIQIMPPLTIEQDVLEKGVDILVETVRSLK